jgi:succinate-semialdehyde dehydrogenase/glutarate-semialdehyde dehydrogenase
MSDYAVVDPATGETLKTYDTITDEALTEAIARAAAAHGPWGRETTVEERAEIIRRVGELHTERRQELGEIIVREMGKPIEQALGEVDFAAAIYEYYADNAADLLKDEPIELLEGDGSAIIRRSSVGLLLGIMPWNYPYYQVARFAGPNLVIGNTILLKHAPQCPESAAAMEDIFHAAGVPADAYINIYATNEQIAEVIADSRVQGVSLTGSGRAGAAVAEVAGRHLKKVVLELGGSDPFIVLKADDLDTVVEAAVGGRLENTGQACNAAKRFIVVNDLYDEFTEKFTAALTQVEPGDPNSPDTTIGPLSSTSAAERLEQQLKQALDGGATLVAGGEREGNFFKTTVITDVTKDNPAYTEEFFGPVAQVYRVADEDEAVRLANDTPFGLGSYVFTTDEQQALRVADRIEAGMVFVNAVGAEGVELPFGGIKSSGFGRELGRFGADEFVNKKLIRIAG